MSNRHRTANAFETSLNGGITSGATTIAVDSAAGLVQPVYLVLDPDVPAKREFIRVGVISGNNLQTVTRGLTGSTAGAQAHDSGAIVRAVVTSQLIDFIFQDIETLEAADTAHFGGTDTADHPEVTTSVRGFMLAADKVKLNALDTAKQVTGGDTHDHAGGDGAQISHAGLSNLGTGDPHPQYMQSSEVDTSIATHAADFDAHGTLLFVAGVDETNALTFTGSFQTLESTALAIPGGGATAGALVTACITIDGLGSGGEAQFRFTLTGDASVSESFTHNVAAGQTATVSITWWTGSITSSATAVNFQGRELSGTVDGLAVALTVVVVRTT